ncbi:hypothetical protein F4779DRAFT_435303 [Xylariaceae sp. FL0662B]|nr:hypothetical protein F4779DRAFT_435303 [Xylariaceae sp. FL0662B]
MIPQYLRIIPMNTLRLVLLCTFIMKITADGGYLEDCQNMTVTETNGHLGLKADCKTSAGSTQCSLLDLNDCYGADAGRIVPEDGGHFNDACFPQDCQLDGSTLMCRCYKHPQDVGGGHRASRIDTNELITSDNGIIKCFDHRATTPSNCTQIVQKSDASRARAPFLLDWARAVSAVLDSLHIPLMSGLV